MNQTSGKLLFPAALTPDGWRTNVLVTVADGTIAAIACDTADIAARDAVRISGIALPGLSNVHSHAFQRGMAGLAERGGPRDDHFWSWREVMYRFLAVLGPEDIETISALAYMEMLESGFTSVGEFHYLHNDPVGQPYAQPAELAARIVAAASTTGIGLALLPVFYAHGGFGGAPPTSGQRRFIQSMDSFANLLEACRTLLAQRLPDSTLGVAPHSLRAVTPEELANVVELAGPVAPVHIHAAEQVKEVADCCAALGAPPVAWLLDHAAVDERWCLIHATHALPAELARLAEVRAVAGLCPVTEANLGDGIFAATDYLSAGGRFAVGTDSNIAISAAQELRALEYSQRLRDRARNRLAPDDTSTGRRLFSLAAASGAQALGRRSGRLAPGLRADIVVLDADHPALAGRNGDAILDSWIFATAHAAVSDVFVAGRHVVTDGLHRDRERILANWRICAARLKDCA